jgi:hypothetical protein
VPPAVLHPLDLRKHPAENLVSAPPPPAPAEGTPLEVSIADLRLAGTPGSPAYQPRELVPPEALADLLARGVATPAGLLAAMDELAVSDARVCAELDALRDMATSIASEGVREPIHVHATTDGALVILSGHRRSLASLLAGKETIPALRYAEMTSAMAATTHALLTNIHRKNLGPVEESNAMFRLITLLCQERAKVGGALTTPEQIVRGAATGDEGAPGASRHEAATIRDEVLARTGYSPRWYYTLLSLQRLTPRVRWIGAVLSAKCLAPVAKLDADDQFPIVEFALRRSLGEREITELVRICLEQGRNAVEQLMKRMEEEATGPRRHRPQASWHPLLNGVPVDVHPRLRALRADLDTLPAAQRRDRLALLWTQDRLLGQVRDGFAEIFAAYEYHGPALAVAEVDAAE